MTTPSSSHLSLYHHPCRERLARCTAPPAHSPPLLPSSGCLTQIQTLRIISTQALIDALTAALPPPSLPPLPPSIPIPSPVDHHPEFQRDRYGFISTVDAEEAQEELEMLGTGLGILGWNRQRKLHRGIYKDLYAYSGCVPTVPLMIGMTLQENSKDGEEGRPMLRELGPRSIGLSQATHQELQTHQQRKRARQPGPEARIPDHQGASMEATRVTSSVNKVMAASTIPVSAEENLGDPIDIRVDIIHPEPVAAVAFPAAAIVRTQAQHGEAID
ncbi:hypothetical protein Tco_1215275 [Tanacetum coccineum]